MLNIREASHRPPHQARVIDALQRKFLRATFATRLGDASYTAFEIAELLGHAANASQDAKRPPMRVAVNA